MHQFYHDSSKLGRPEANGFMGVTSTMKVSGYLFTLFSLLSWLVFWIYIVMPEFLSWSVGSELGLSIVEVT